MGKSKYTRYYFGQNDYRVWFWRSADLLGICFLVNKDRVSSRPTEHPVRLPTVAIIYLQSVYCDSPYGHADTHTPLRSSICARRTKQIKKSEEGDSKCRGVCFSRWDLDINTIKGREYELGIFAFVSRGLGIVCGWEATFPSKGRGWAACGKPARVKASADLVGIVNLRRDEAADVWPSFDLYDLCNVSPSTFYDISNWWR